MRGQAPQRVAGAVLGVDPGSRCSGYAVLAACGARSVLLEHGTLRLPPKLDWARRLRVLHEGLAALIERWEPQAVAVEDIFVARHPRAALALGHARGVVLLAAAQADLPVHAYPPALVKRAIVGRGRASKEQVARMVQVLLGLPERPPQDAADAMAVALTHLRLQVVAAQARLLRGAGPDRR